MTLVKIVKIPRAGIVLKKSVVTKTPTMDIALTRPVGVMAGFRDMLKAVTAPGITHLPRRFALKEVFSRWITELVRNSAMPR